MVKCLIATTYINQGARVLLSKRHKNAIILPYCSLETPKNRQKPPLNDPITEKPPIMTINQRKSLKDNICRNLPHYITLSYQSCIVDYIG